MDKYEKLYNEALERFKSFKEKYYTKDTNLGDVIFDKNGEMQKDFNGIFLELAESEDERIRKEMVEKISNLACGCFISQEQKQKFIAYLEKQKEQKPWKVGANAYFTPEQKPEEWSEGDEKIVNNIVSVLGQYIDYKAVSGTGSGYATPRYAKEIDWLNSLRTTNQGWGKEDEEMRKLLIAILEVNHPDGFFKANELGTTDMRGVHTEEIIAWLKSLHPVKQEWSEEDEDMLNSCISSIEEAKENRYAYKETDGDTSYDREINWLKSLRPSWKPSEEQMEALDALNCHGDLSYVGQQNQLISLYNDLKKLKGGVAPMREIDE